MPDQRTPAAHARKPAAAAQSQSQSQSQPRRRSKPAAVPTPAPADKLCASAWIIEHHDTWSRLTLSTFYKDLADQSLTQEQYDRWLLDRTSVSLAVLKAATRTNEMLRMAGPDTVAGTGSTGTTAGATLQLPLLAAAKDDAHFLAQYAEMNGFDICSEYRVSHAAQKLVDFIDASTAPDASLVVAVTAVWTYMLASWTEWALCLNRPGAASMPAHFGAIGRFLSRQSAMGPLSDTQTLIDGLLAAPRGAAAFGKAGAAFEEVASRAVAVLDHTLYMADVNQIPLCTCGRKGHPPEQCTFKSHF